MFIKRKSMFELLNEADDDNTEEGGGDGGSDNNSDSGSDTDTGDIDDTATDSSTDDDGGEDSEGDFDIDANLDEDDGGDGEDSDTDDSGEDSGDDYSSDTTGDGEEEPVDANTEIFASLSAKEQAIKIKELKKLFRDLYTSTDDILERINDIDTSEENMDIITRVTRTLYAVKEHMRDYINNIFATKSYIENDITFNRFLSILDSIGSVIEDLAKIKESRLKKNDKK